MDSAIYLGLWERGRMGPASKPSDHGVPDRTRKASGRLKGASGVALPMYQRYNAS
jgi:hypothetical protein